MFLSNNPSSGDINSSNLPCSQRNQDVPLIWGFSQRNRDVPLIWVFLREIVGCPFHLAVFSEKSDVPLIWSFLSEKSGCPSHLGFFSEKSGCPSHLGFSLREIGMSLSSGFFLRKIGMSLSSGVFSQRNRDVPLIWGFLDMLQTNSNTYKFTNIQLSLSNKLRFGCSSV